MSGRQRDARGRFLSTGGGGGGGGGDGAPRKKRDKVGTKRQVFAGTAARTSGGLTKDQLIKNKRGKVVSKAKSALAKSRFPNGPPR